MLAGTKNIKQEFIEFALACGVLKFGRFELKSGRVSPYFFNTGLFDSGAKLARLSEYYAGSIVNAGVDFDMLFGPAYKGIPLAAAIAVSLARQFDRDVGFCFNRKEMKDHGEGGRTFGAPLAGRVLIVDDVISAGLSVREAVDLIKASHAQPAGVVISLDREERGEGTRSATTEVAAEFGIPVYSIISLSDVVGYLEARGHDQANLGEIAAYRRRYGGV